MDDTKSEILDVGDEGASDRTQDEEVNEDKMEIGFLGMERLTQIKTVQGSTTIRENIYKRR